MSGKKQFKEQADEGFLRAAWDLAADQRLSAGVDVFVRLDRNSRKGVWTIVLTAYGNPAVWAVSTVEEYRVDWPRSEVATLAAALFQGFHKLDLQVGEAITRSWQARDGLWEEDSEAA